MLFLIFFFFFFFFNDTATTEIYTLSLHDALPIYSTLPGWTPFYPYISCCSGSFLALVKTGMCYQLDRKSTRLNSSHLVISYAVFCLKKKKKNYSQYYTI